MDGTTLRIEDFKIETLGSPKYQVPQPEKKIHHVRDNDRIIFHNHEHEINFYHEKKIPLPSLELAGPRQKIYFNPAQTKIGIVTCGGICPGLNAIIRSVVYTSTFYYGIKEVYGFRNGYSGLNPQCGYEPLLLKPDLVDYILEDGGTILGTSRGPQPVKIIVDYLQKLKINILFTVGGDGTLKGAHEIAGEIKKRKLNISIVGIPKTIDNDIAFIERSFGFETAVEQAKHVLISAHEEARSVVNGIGLVKLMGRDSGFIAAMATLAAPVVNFCLVPEVLFKLEGPGGLFKILEKRLNNKKHAVIAVAEGAGQDLIRAAGEAIKDASGNIIHNDIGLFLKARINEYFAKAKLEVNLKYIDPSYLIRSVPPNADDSAFCLLLAQNAVHAGMAGKTDLAVGYRNGHYVDLPLRMVVTARKKIVPNGRLWASVLDTTGQPAKLG